MYLSSVGFIGRILAICLSDMEKQLFKALEKAFAKEKKKIHFHFPVEN